MYKKGNYKHHAYYIGLIRRFQGIGFMVSSDNPITTHDYLLIDIRFLWLRAWYAYEYQNK